MPAPTELLKRASMHHQAGQLDQATKLYRQLLVKNPKSPELYLRLADICQRQGHFNETLAYLNKAYQLAPDHFATTFALACCYHQFGKITEALQWYQTTLKLEPNHSLAHNNLGSLLRQMGQMDDAITHYETALQNHPQPHVIRHNLGNLYMEAQRLDDAEATYNAVLQESPDFADAYFGLGRVAQKRHQPDLALSHFEKACALDPQSAAYAYQLGLVHKRRENFEDAERFFDQAITLVPHYAEAHMGKAMLSFMQGDFPSAWPEYEWRLRLPGHKGVQIQSSKTQWRGEPLEGKTLLIHMEQGFGDAIQFVRFLPRIKALNPANIVFIVADELGHLFTQSELPVNRYIGVGKGKLPAFDYHIPLLSIPGVLNLTLDEIAQINAPYLKVSSGSFAMWSHQIPRTSRKQIGMVWTGRETHAYNSQRSVPLELFGELTGTKGTRWVSLQKDLPKPELPGEWFDVYHPLSNFADTAAIIQCLDLVITIDTSVAHLAGALGKPTWLLLDTDPDWRWFLHREDSPWYPSVRIFRQNQPGDWTSVIAQVKQALTSPA